MLYCNWNDFVAYSFLLISSSTSNITICWFTVAKLWPYQQTSHKYRQPVAFLHSTILKVGNETIRTRVCAHTASPGTDCADVASCTNRLRAAASVRKRESARKSPRRYVRKGCFYPNNIQLLQLDDEIKLFSISTHPSSVALDAPELRHWTLFQSCVEHEAVVIPSILYLTSSHSRDEVIAKNARHVCCSLIGCCVRGGWRTDEQLRWVRADLLKRQESFVIKYNYRQKSALLK